MPKNTRTPELSNTRTDRDWIMIVLGVCLVIFFVVGGYLSCCMNGKSAPPKLRGPVKDPASLGDSRLTTGVGVIVLRLDRTSPSFEATP